jgi:hypothetical protein
VRWCFSAGWRLEGKKELAGKAEWLETEDAGNAGRGHAIEIQKKGK